MAEEGSIQPKLSFFFHLERFSIPKYRQLAYASETARPSVTRWRRKRPPPQAKYIFVFSVERSIRVRALQTPSRISVGPVLHRA